MVYERMNLQNGDTLTGDHIRHLEDGIANAQVSPMFVTYAHDTMIANHTSGEIYDHVQANGEVYLQFDDGSLLIPQDITQDLVTFTNLADDGVFQFYSVADDGTVEYVEKSIPSAEYVEQLYVPLLVTLSDDRSTASHKPSQILDHIRYGGRAYLALSDTELVALQDVNKEAATFAIIGEDPPMQYWTICADGTVDNQERYVVTYEDLDSATAPLIVTYSTGTGLASHSAYDIYTYKQKGGEVLLSAGGSLMLPIDVTQSKATFISPSTDDMIWQFYEIWDDYTVVHNEIGIASLAYVEKAIANAQGGGSETMELISAVTVDESVRTVVLEDGFCLKKFLVVVKVPAASGTASTVQVTFMEKLDNGTYNGYLTFPTSLIADNSPRYASFWGSVIAGQPAEIYTVPASQYDDLMTGIQCRPIPIVVNKGLTRLLFYALTTDALFPVGTTIELWGVRA